VIVVDTNILAYHCLPGPRNRDTEQLLQFDPEWTAPVLWRSEFRNLLCGYLRRGEMDIEKAREVITDATDSLKGGEHTVSDHAVLALVAQSRCTAYDCEFAALAEALGTVLVTEDKALLTAFPKLCRSLTQMLK
jgi:predicted nucleic acid-binding protein